MITVSQPFDGPAFLYVDTQGDTKALPPWQDSMGNWWTPGEITPDGHIVGKPGTFVTAGVVYIDSAQLGAAKSAGWRQVDDIAPNGLTKVSRS